MAIDFPNSPSVGEIFYVGNVAYQWDGATWNAFLEPASVFSHAYTHGSTGDDAVTIAQSQVTNLGADLALKAPLASPALTGTPSAPTAATGTNTTQVATTAFVNNEIINDAIVKTLIDAKGDLIVGSADNTAVRVAAGTNGYMLVANSAATAGVEWVKATAGATGGGNDQAFFENDITITTSYTITAGKNAITGGPVTVNTGATITVPSGSTWTVV